MFLLFLSFFFFGQFSSYLISHNFPLFFLHNLKKSPTHTQRHKSTDPKLDESSPAPNPFRYPQMDAESVSARFHFHFHFHFRFDWCRYCHSWSSLAATIGFLFWLFLFLFGFEILGFWSFYVWLCCWILIWRRRRKYNSTDRVRVFPESIGFFLCLEGILGNLIVPRVWFETGKNGVG